MKIDVYAKLDKPMLNVVKTAERLGLVTTDSCSGHKGGSLYPYVGLSVENDTALKAILTRSVGRKHKDEFEDVYYHSKLFKKLEFTLFDYPKHSESGITFSKYKFAFSCSHISKSHKYFIYLHSIYQDGYYEKYFLQGYPQSVKEFYVEQAFVILLTEIATLKSRLGD